VSTSASVRLEPPDLSDAIRRVVVSERARGHSRVSKIVERAEPLDIQLVDEKLLDRDHDSINQQYRYEKRTLMLDVNPGSFMKPWPSDPHLVGNDEWCLTPVEGCPLDCSYCYLQDYLDRPLVKAFVNQEQMREQIENFAEDPPDDPPYYFSLGELSDGVFLEPLLNTIPIVWDSFRDRDQYNLEVRTKSHHVHQIPERVHPHDQGVFTWSLSPESVARTDEMLTSSLDQRISAMKYLIDSKFHVGVRRDPVLLKDDWRSQYRTLIDNLFQRIPPEDLKFLILGTFRFPRGFDETIEERFPNREILRDEFVEGPDGTYRYARCLRTEVFQDLSELLRDMGVDPDLCMEPRYIWEDVDLDRTSYSHA